MHLLTCIGDKLHFKTRSGLTGICLIYASVYCILSPTCNLNICMLFSFLNLILSNLLMLINYFKQKSSLFACSVLLFQKSGGPGPPLLLTPCALWVLLCVLHFTADIKICILHVEKLFETDCWKKHSEKFKIDNANDCCIE